MWIPALEEKQEVARSFVKGLEQLSQYLKQMHEVFSQPSASRVSLPDCLQSTLCHTCTKSAALDDDQNVAKAMLSD